MREGPTKPTFEIINDDCLTAFERLAKEGRTFDVLLADPPYCSGGMTPAEISRGGIKKYSKMTELGDFFDGMSQRAFYTYSREWLFAARKILKPTAYFFLFIDWRQIPTLSDAVQASHYCWRGLGVWDKLATRYNPGQFAQSAEFILWGTVGTQKSDKFQKSCVFQRRAVQPSNRIHPTQKNADVIRDLFQILPDGATDVLEPFSGSSAGGIAALTSGMNYVGIELDAAYAQASRIRLEQAMRDYDLTGQVVDRLDVSDAPTLFDLYKERGVSVAEESSVTA